jgi:flagellar biosynthesis protein FliQ
LIAFFAFIGQISEAELDWMLEIFWFLVQVAAAMPWVFDKLLESVN